MTKIEYFPVVDFVTEEIGKKIESFYPLLELLHETKEESPEYNFLNSIWSDWCRYLET